MKFSKPTSDVAVLLKDKNGKLAAEMKAHKGPLFVVSKRKKQK